MNRAAEQTIFYLKELGFTEYEAKVYICLLDQHPATAYTISQKFISVVLSRNRDRAIPSASMAGEPTPGSTISPAA